MMKSAPIGDEILVLTFARWPAKRICVTESEIIHVFWILSKFREFKKLLRNYAFDTDGLRPRCEGISSGLTALAHSGLVSWDMDFSELTLNQPALLKRLATVCGGAPREAMGLISVFDTALMVLRKS